MAAASSPWANLRRNLAGKAPKEPEEPKDALAVRASAALYPAGKPAAAVAVQPPANRSLIERANEKLYGKKP